MIGVAYKYKNPQAEREETKILLESYIKQMEEHKRPVNGMIKVDKQLKAGNFTVLLLDSPIPLTRFSKLKIDGAEYKIVVVYDLKNSIGIAETGNFEGKQVFFIE